MRTLYWIGAASAVTLTAAAFALPGAKPSKMDGDGNGVVSKAEAMTAADSMFAKMDVNTDGKIDAADREAKVKAHFKEMDADGNGAITEAEMIAAHQKRMEDRPGKHDTPGHDGERMGRHGGGHRGGGHGGHHGGPNGGFGMAMVKKADANGDMAVTQAEFHTAAEARFTKADTNKDGSLSADEQKAAHAAMRAQRDAPPPPMP